MVHLIFEVTTFVPSKITSFLPINASKSNFSTIVRISNSEPSNDLKCGSLKFYSKSKRKVDQIKF